ncbi:MAG: ABC transporter ATP-binding protein, partial [Chlorobium limicola]|nr:ABC transporter ATP-binding protein [Chlorobium limicola]
MNIAALKFRITTALHLGRALQVVWNYASGWTLLNAALVFLQGMFPLAAFYLMKRIVDTVTLLITNPPDKALQQSLASWIALAVSVAFCSSVVNALREYTGESQSRILSDKVADILHEKSIALDLSYYEDPSYFDTLHRAQAEAPYRLPRIVSGLIDIGRNSISLLGILILLFSFSGTLVLVLFLAALPVAMTRILYSQKAFRFERSITEPERKAWYYHTVMTDSMAAKELRMFDFGSLFRSRFQELKKEIRDKRLNLVRSRMIWDIFSQLLIVLALFGSILWIAYRTIQGKLSLGDLVAFYLAFQGGLGYLQATFRALAGLYEDNLFLANLYEFLELKPVIVTPEHPEKFTPPLKTGIVFDNVGFSYPGSSLQAIQNIDLTLAPNQVIALVGDNGSGKTTLVKLLCRLYDPTAGTITADGIDLKSIDPAEWRKQISVIFQDYAHYALKVWENIWL